MKWYNVFDDIDQFPDASIFITVGGRATGKTYGCLKGCINRHKRFVFCKRHQEQIRHICGGNKVDSKETVTTELSPFKSINKDLGWNIQALQLDKDIGFFQNMDTNETVGYILALASAHKYRDSDFQDADYVIFDEFIPSKSERGTFNDGFNFLQIAKTVQRARTKANSDFKCILLANANDIGNSVFIQFDILQEVGEMVERGDEYLYIKDRGIVVHMLPDSDEYEKDRLQDPLYLAFANTEWGEMAYNNEFSSNDFSSIGNRSVKKADPVCMIMYKKKYWTLWKGDGFIQVRANKTDKDVPFFDLNRESDQSAYWYYFGDGLKNLWRTQGFNVYFQNYEQFNVLIHFKEVFKNGVI